MSKNLYYEYLQKTYNAIPCEKIEQAIKKMEQARDKDKLCEYPYNRCINILKEVLNERKTES